MQVTFDCADPAALSGFWASVLGYAPPQREGGDDWYRITDPTGQRPTLFFQRVPEPKTVRNRVHLDVATPADGPEVRRDQIDSEVERVVGLGAPGCHGLGRRG